MKPDPLPTNIYHKIPPRARNSIKKIIKKCDIGIAMKFYFGEGSILRTKGWIESERRGEPVDENGNPIPWYTYSAIDFLDSRLNDELRVFEYGGGNSTRWYADRVNEVVAVDSSCNWTEEIETELPENASIIHRSNKTQYIHEVTSYAPFDVIVIDGDHRSECLEPAMSSLTTNGIIIRDDYQRIESERNPEVKLLFDSGFRVMPFWGVKGLNSHYRCTSVFYRDNNCLDI